MARESKGSGDIGFPILDSRTSGLHVCSSNVSTYCMRPAMAAVEPGFEDSLSQALGGINLENVSLRVQQKEAIKNIVVSKKDSLIILPTGFGKSLIFQLLPFVFDSWLGASKSFILVVSPLNALMRDQTVKLNDLQVRSLMVRNTESLSEVEIRDIKESKYRIIYGHPEAFVGKLRKVLDCEEVRRNLRAVVVDEAHLIVEWQVFLFLS